MAEILSNLCSEHDFTCCFFSSAWCGVPAMKVIKPRVHFVQLHLCLPIIPCGFEVFAVPSSLMRRPNTTSLRCEVSVWSSSSPFFPVCTQRWQTLPKLPVSSAEWQRYRLHVSSGENCLRVNILWCCFLPGMFAECAGHQNNLSLALTALLKREQSECVTAITVCASLAVLCYIDGDISVTFTEMFLQGDEETTGVSTWMYHSCWLILIGSSDGTLKGAGGSAADVISDGSIATVYSLDEQEMLKLRPQTLTFCWFWQLLMLGLGD